jgi:molybdopterin-guanine dinucleotide biosynthesis protein A
MSPRQAMSRRLPAGGVVLAGGRSRRFGRNKLAESMPDGRTILAHAVQAMAEVCSDVVVVIAPEVSRPAGLPPRARVVVDPESFGGPLVGLVTGLTASSSETVLVAGGDMPELVPAVLTCLAESLERIPADAVRLANGEMQSLPFAIRRGPALRAAQAALDEGDRRLRGLFERLAVAVVAEGEWRLLDPAARTLRDIDRPGDLFSSPSGRTTMSGDGPASAGPDNR